MIKRIIIFFIITRFIACITIMIIIIIIVIIIIIAITIMTSKIILQLI